MILLIKEISLKLIVKTNYSIMAKCYKYKGGETKFTADEMFDDLSKSKINNDSILRFIDLNYPITLKLGNEYFDVKYKDLKQFVIDRFPKSSVTEKDIYNKINEILKGNEPSITVMSINTPVDIDYVELKSLHNSKQNQFIVAIDENNKTVFGTKNDILQNIKFEELSGNIRYKVANITLNNSRDLKGREILDASGNNVFDREEVQSYWELKNNKPYNDKYYTSSLINSLIKYDSLIDPKSKYFSDDFVSKYNQAVVSGDTNELNNMVLNYMNLLNVKFNKDKDGNIPFTEKNFKLKEISKRKSDITNILKSFAYNTLKLKNDNNEYVFKYKASEVIAPAPNGSSLGIKSDVKKSDIDKNVYSFFKDVVESEYAHVFKKLRKKFKYLFDVNIESVLDLTPENIQITNEKISRDLLSLINFLNDKGFTGTEVESLNKLLYHILNNEKFEDGVFTLKTFSNLAKDFDSKIENMIETFTHKVTAKRVDTYNRGLITIYNRTPGQGKQSYFVSKTVAFSTGNVVRMSENDAVIQGGDFDGDALGQFFYSLDKFGGILSYTKYQIDGKLFDNDSELISNFSESMFAVRNKSSLIKIIEGLTKKSKGKDDVNLLSDEEKSDLELASKLIDTEYTEETSNIISKYKSDYPLSLSDVSDIDTVNLLNFIDTKSNEIHQKDIDNAIKHLITKRDEAFNASSLYFENNNEISIDLFDKVVKLDKEITRIKTRLDKAFIGSIKNFVIDKLKSAQEDIVNQLETSIAVDSAESKRIADRFSDPEYIKNKDADDNYDLVNITYSNTGTFGTKYAIGVGQSAIGIVANALAQLSLINKFSIGLNEKITAYNFGEGLRLSYPNNLMDNDGNVVTNVANKIVMNPEEIVKQMSFSVEFQSDENSNLQSLIDDSVIEEVKDIIFSENKKSSYKIHGPAIWESLSELMTDAVDNAKLLMLDKLGINNTSLPYILASVTSGFSLADTIYFFNQREIRAIFKKGGNIDTQIKSALSEYRNKYNTDLENELNNSVKLFNDVSKLNLDAPINIITNNQNTSDLLKASLDDVGVNYLEGDGLAPLEEYEAETTIVLMDNISDGMPVESYDSEIVYYIDNRNGHVYLLSNGVLNYINGKNIDNAFISGDVFIKGEYSNRSLKSLNKIINSSLVDEKSGFPRANKFIKDFDSRDILNKSNTIKTKRLNNPVLQLKDLVSVTEEYSFIQAILGFKNASNNSNIDMKKYRDRISRAGKKLLKRSDSGIEFNLDKYINDPIYRSEIINILELDKVAVNPFLVSWGMEVSRINLKMLNVEKIIGIAIPKLGIVNHILDEHMINIDNRLERNIESWIGGTAIDAYFDSNDIVLNYKSEKPYKLSLMSDRNRLVKDFSKIITDAKNDDKLSSNTLIASLELDQVSNNADDDINIKFVNLLKGIDPVDLAPDLEELRSLSPELYNAMKYYSLLITRGNPRNNDIYNIFDDVKTDFEEFFNEFVTLNSENLKSVTPEVLLLSNPRLSNNISSNMIVKFGANGKLVMSYIDDRNIDHNVPLIKKHSYYSSAPLITKYDFDNNNFFNIVKKLGYEIGYNVVVDNEGHTDNIIYYDIRTNKYFSERGSSYAGKSLSDHNDDMLFDGPKFGPKSEIESDMQNNDIRNFKLNKKEKIGVLNGTTIYKIINEENLGNIEEGSHVGYFNVDEIQYELIYKSSLNKREFQMSDIVNMTSKHSIGYDKLNESKKGERFVILEIRKRGEVKIPWTYKRISSAQAKSHKLNTMFKFMLSDKIPQQLQGGEKAFINNGNKIHSVSLKGYLKYDKTIIERKDSIISLISNGTFDLSSTEESKDKFLKDNIGYDPKYSTYVYKWINGNLDESEPDGLYVFDNTLITGYGFLNSSDEENFLSSETFGSSDVMNGVIFNTDNSVFLQEKHGSKINQLGAKESIDDDAQIVIDKINNEFNIIISNLELDSLPSSSSVNRIYNQINDNDILVIDTPISIKEIDNRFSYNNINKEASIFIENAQRIDGEKYDTTSSINELLSRVVALSEKEMLIYGVTEESLISIKSSIEEYADADLKIPLDLKQVMDNEYYVHVEIAKKLGKPIYIRTTKSSNNNLGTWFSYNKSAGSFDYMQEVPKIGPHNTDEKLSIAVFSNDNNTISNLVKSYVNYIDNATKQPDYVPNFDRVIDYTNGPEIDEEFDVSESIPTGLDNITRASIDEKTSLIDGKEFDSIEILDLSEGSIHIYSEDFIILNKDGLNYVLHASESEVSESDNFANLRVIEGKYIRHNGKLYSSEKLVVLNENELIYRKSTKGINTSIVYDSDSIKSMINDNNIPEKVKSLLKAIPYSNNNDINPLHETVSFSELVNMLKNGYVNDYTSNPNVLELVNEIIRYGNKKTDMLKDLRTKHTKIKNKYKLRVLTVEQSPILDTDIKVFLKYHSNKSIANIKKDNSYNNVIISDPSRMKQNNNKDEYVSIGINVDTARNKTKSSFDILFGEIIRESDKTFYLEIPSIKGKMSNGVSYGDVMKSFVKSAMANPSFSKVITDGRIKFGKNAAKMINNTDGTSSFLDMNPGRIINVYSTGTLNTLRLKGEFNLNDMTMGDKSLMDIWFSRNNMDMSKSHKGIYDVTGDPVIKQSMLDSLLNEYFMANKSELIQFMQKLGSKDLYSTRNRDNYSIERSLANIINDYNNLEFINGKELNFVSIEENEPVLSNDINKGSYISYVTDFDTLTGKTDIAYYQDKSGLKIIRRFKDITIDKDTKSINNIPDDILNKYKALSLETGKEYKLIIKIKLNHWLMD